ncbi:MAG: hypothetical protein QXL17_02800 [Candidatus Thermoplasmatota archaeon]
MKKFIQTGKINGFLYCVQCIDGETVTATITLNNVEETREFVTRSAAEEWVLIKTLKFFD